jgi:hypothetical protein
MEKFKHLATTVSNQKHDYTDEEIRSRGQGTKVVLETSEIFNHLIRLIAREDFINVSGREGFCSYNRGVLANIHLRIFSLPVSYLITDSYK